VFVVRSSLQYLLATALAADLRERRLQECRMLFLPDVLDPGLFSRAARAWSESPFDRVVTVEPRRLPGSNAPPRGSGAIRRELEAALVAARPLSLTVFNDREEAGQAALIATARRFPQAERRCAEDGSLAYTNFSYRAHGLVTRLRQKLRLGSAWSDVRVLGTHPLVQQFIAMHPLLLRAELQQRPLQRFPMSALESTTLRSLAAALCSAVGFSPRAVPAGAAILTVSHSSYAARNPDYVALVEACAIRLRQRRERFFVKYHPRETQEDPLGLLKGDAAREIARSLPVECLYLMLRDRPLTVVGGMSTSLLTAGLLMPQLHCAALVHATAAGDRWGPRLLQELRITPLEDVQAINAYFDA
jgi:hypothetical protein